VPSSQGPLDAGPNVAVEEGERVQVAQATVDPRQHPEAAAFEPPAGEGVLREFCQMPPDGLVEDVLHRVSFAAESARGRVKTAVAPRNAVEIADDEEQAVARGEPPVVNSAPEVPSGSRAVPAVAVDRCDS
jgi:hypothetical protein